MRRHVAMSPSSEMIPIAVSLTFRWLLRTGKTKSEPIQYVSERFGPHFNDYTGHTGSHYETI